MQHQQDTDCTIDPITGCCRICGVDHSQVCSDCQGRGFHRPECPRDDSALSQALERSRQIQSKRLRIIAVKTTVEEGRVKTKWLVDAGELGRGKCF